MSGPPPSSLVLLADLQNCDPGKKVRFLGCVDEYVPKTATLLLRHNHPPVEPPKTVRVNIRVVLESVRSKEIDVGSWINVIGYVEDTETDGISVQAVAVWDAGNIDLEVYQRGVEARTEVE